MIRIALPKGNIYDKSKQLACRLLDVKDVSKLKLKNKNIEIYFVKHRDIPCLIEKGYFDIGITSEEWIVEQNSGLEILHKTNWCNTRISYIESKYVNGETGICATEFSNIAKMYFEKKERKVHICKVSGSCEAYVPEIFGCCVDCVETGNTIKKNGLVEKEVIMNSQIVVVAKGKDNIDNSFLERLIREIENI